MTNVTNKTTSKPASVKLITDAAALNKAIDSIESRGKKLQDDMHVAALSCLQYAEQHGDVTLMQRLIVALPSSTRKNALLAWASDFGKFAVSEDGKSVVYNKHGKTDLATATAKPFWDYVPEQPFKPFDIAAELAKLVKRAEKAAKDERNSLPDDQFRAVRELASKLGA